MKYQAIALLLVILAHSMPLAATYADDLSLAGGELTSDLPLPASIQVNAPNVINEERRLAQIAGFAPFHKIYTRADGMGATFINPSCSGCHINNGRGPIRLRPRGLLASTVVIKVGRRGTDEFGTSRELPRIGAQLHDRAFGRRKADSARLRWRIIRRRHPDGSRYSLRRPVLTLVFRPGRVRIVSRRIASSIRMTPPIIGPGLLENIPVDALRANEDPSDINHDGIKGRLNMTLDVQTGERVVGRFGFKAAQPTVLQQTASAFSHDMNLSNSLFPATRRDNAISDEVLQLVDIYLQLAGVPRSRSQNDENIIAGRTIFDSLGCADCHIPGFTTSTDSPYPELHNQRIFPYSDLLLHDMGRGLADSYREFDARGKDWRTTPLWSIGLSRELLGGARRKPTYLHDGRARTLEEAIMWHGGEALRSRNEFSALAASERALLIEFLSSL